MRKIGLFCLTLCLMVAVSVKAVSASSEETVNNTVLNGAHSLDGNVPLLGSARLVNNVESAIVFETKSQTLMHAYNADEQIHPASLVKIMTALIVAERADLSKIVTVSESAISSIPSDAVSADLVPKELITVGDLLYCMMVGSANDAAAVLAEHISGTQSAFVAEMNRYAQELGCKQTNFTNVHGLHDEMQYSTTRDMAKILAKAMENEVFCTVFGEVYYKVPATNMSAERSLSSGNYLMNDDDVQIYRDTRVTGGRTAVTDAGFLSIATSAEHNGMQLICIITGAESVYREDGYTVQIFGGYNETSGLLNAGFEGFETKQVIYAGQAVQQYAVENGASDVVVGTVESVRTVLPAGAGLVDLDFRITNKSSLVTAPVEKGQILSALEVWHGDVCVAQVDLHAMNSVPIAQSQVDERDLQSDRVSWKLLLITVICTFVGITVLWIGFIAVGNMHKAAQRKRNRQHRKNRRRSR